MELPHAVKDQIKGDCTYFLLFPIYFLSDPYLVFTLTFLGPHTPCPAAHTEP